MGRLLRALRSKVNVESLGAGMSTVEYAIGIVAACALAAFLYKLLTGNWVEGIIKGFIDHALHLIPGL
jgi:hypothetical protein